MKKVFVLILLFSLTGCAAQTSVPNTENTQTDSKIQDNAAEIQAEDSDSVNGSFFSLNGKSQNTKDTEKQTNTQESKTKHKKEDANISSSSTCSLKDTEEPHKHNWKQQYKTIYHEPIHDTRYVIDETAWDETIPIYEMREHIICNVCRNDLTVLGSAGISDHLKQHSLRGEGGSWRSEWIQEVVDYEVIHHPETGHNEQIVVQESYEEKVPDGMICSICKTTK